ncbi:MULTISPECIES: DNA polymerase III subunit delta [Clostridium]|uniref:DNA polymerase III subunit delta n=1 Tax=Clostridium TaxID=1485 RepID=UPI000824B46F|nr:MULTISPECIES: DNA polymerase III subunit delta [Clostridium]PJI07094.1 DNA polymerase III subunit delta [Clostridium sp. CT7]
MINYTELEENINRNKINNVYVMCGFNEKLMKEDINKILKKSVDASFETLNYSTFDGNNIEFDEIMNACETVPFMSEKRVVVVYRADFLSDNSNGSNKNYDKLIKSIEKYVTNIPEYCILILYYVFDNPREKPSYKVRKFDKKACVVEFSKLRGMQLQKKVKEVFQEKKKPIGKTELNYFCSKVDNNMDIIYNEVEKLCCYTLDREITKQDIDKILQPNENDDIFNLVDYISQSRPEMAVTVLNEIMYKGVKANSILYMIERQFKLMLSIKVGIESGKTKEILSRELKLNPYVCEKMMNECKRFSMKKILKALEICLNTEKELKSVSKDPKFKMETLIINIAII